jgi:O-antigen biosynthesis protein
MNILFLTSAAPEKSGFPTGEKRPPLGVGFLMAVLKAEGHNIFFSDEFLQPSTILDGDFLCENAIDFVAIYSNTVCYQSTLQMFEKLEAKRANGLWSGKIMVGGPHTSIGSAEIPAYVDYIVIGEGEVTVPKIIRGEIQERIIRGEPVEDLDTLPMPAYEEFVNLPYDWKHSWHPIEPLFTFNTSRGCPFSCTFCSVKAVWGKTYRFMSAERVVRDIEHVVNKYGVKGIYFREDHFTLNKKRTVEFCELLIKKNLKIEWLCETRVDQLDDYDYQKLMYDAGCRVFYIGVESGSPKMLDFYNKQTTRDQFVNAFDIARKVGIKTYASFVVGFPGESDADRLMTDDLIARIRPDYVGKNVFVGLPGSECYDYLKRNDLCEFEDPNHILYPVGYLDQIKKYYGDKPYFHVYTRDKEVESPGDMILMDINHKGPLVSVVMSVYNGDRFVREAVESILSQTFKSFEFIIINDGSTDGTRSILESFTDERIVLVHQGNIGLTRSLNKGISLARGKYLARQDADDVSNPERLKKQVVFMEENPAVGLLGSRFEFIDEAGLVTRQAFLPLENEVLQEKLINICQFCHSSVLVRKELLDQVGGYREYFKYAQDYDLWLRLSEKCEIRNLPEFLVQWRESGDAISSENILLQSFYAGVAANMAVQRRNNVADDLQQGKEPAFSAVENLSEDLQSKLSEFYSNYPESMLQSLHQGNASDAMIHLFKKICLERVSFKCDHARLSLKRKKIMQLDVDINAQKNLLLKYEYLTRVKEKDLRAKDDTIALYRSELESLKGRIAELEADIDGFEAVIANKIEHIKQLEINVNSEQMQLENSIKIITDKNTTITRNETTIRDLNATVIQKDIRINELLNSMSWKITSPLRRFLGLFRK